MYSTIIIGKSDTKIAVREVKYTVMGKSVGDLSYLKIAFPYSQTHYFMWCLCVCACMCACVAVKMCYLVAPKFCIIVPLSLSLSVHSTSLIADFVTTT